MNYLNSHSPDSMMISGGEAERGNAAAVYLNIQQLIPEERLRKR
jgi:hypothetical protein